MTNQPPREWTPEELAILKHDYYELGGSGLADVLRRSPGTIRSKASQLGLKHKHKSGWHRNKTKKGFWQKG